MRNHYNKSNGINCLNVYMFNCVDRPFPMIFLSEVFCHINLIEEKKFRYYRLKYNDHL
jgi:hypothetical protein